MSHTPQLPLPPLQMNKPFHVQLPQPYPYNYPVMPSQPRPFSLPSEKKVFVYRGEGNNGETKVFGSFENLKKFLLDRHGRIYEDRGYLSEDEFIEASQGWGFELEIVDFY